jgi:hypothetical protein
MQYEYKKSNPKILDQNGFKPGLGVGSSTSCFFSKE